MVQKHASDVIIIITILCIVKSFSLPVTYPSVTLESAPLHHTHHNRKQNNSQLMTTIEPKHKEFLLSRGWGESSGFPFLVIYSNYARIKQHKLEQQQKQEQQVIEQQQKQELERQQRKHHSEKPINKINMKVQQKHIFDGLSKQNLNVPIFVSNSWGPLGK